MASFMVTLIADSHTLGEGDVAELFEQAMYQVAEDNGMKVFDLTAYQIYTGRK